MAGVSHEPFFFLLGRYGLSPFGETAEELEEDFIGEFAKFMNRSVRRSVILLTEREKRYMGTLYCEKLLKI